MPIAAGLYYFAHGADMLTRPPVVLIHGAGGNHLYWPPQVRRLDNLRVFAVDLPGHGKSAGVGHHTIEDYAGEIVAFLKAMKFSRAVLVGHSMGGAIALQVAIRWPRRVIGLGLLGAAGRLKVNAALLDLAADPSKMDDMAATLTDYSFAAETSSRLKDLAGQRVLEARPSVLYGDLQACDAFDPSAGIAQVAVPVLMIFGEHDRMVPVAAGNLLRGQLNSARLETVPHAGHMVMLEQPERVAELLGGFVDSLPYQPGK